jgi:ABC-type nickel/cobalt efflux system permease component RcnA
VSVCLWEGEREADVTLAEYDDDKIQINYKRQSDASALESFQQKMSQKRATIVDKLEVLLNTANQGLIAITTFYLMWYCYQSGNMWSALSQHAWITTIGYQLLMAEGIMTFYKANSLTSLFSRKEKTHIHWILQAAGGAMALYGCAIFIVERERTGRRHFHGNHALYGES